MNERDSSKEERVNSTNNTVKTHGKEHTYAHLGINSTATRSKSYTHHAMGAFTKEVIEIGEKTQRTCGRGEVTAFGREIQEGGTHCIGENVLKKRAGKG